MLDTKMQNVDRTIRHMALFVSLSLLAACPLAALTLGETPLRVWQGLVRIIAKPSPLVTDYYALGSLSAAFLNAGLCGLACVGLIVGLKAHCEASSWAGYFLVIAHCFYGLNILTIWPCIFGVWVYCKRVKVSFRDNLDMAMFATAFGPFMGELLFRYPFQKMLVVSLGGYALNLVGIPACFALGAILGFAIPALLPGAQLLHRGYNLYNGGLAFGLLGLLLYGFLYKTLGAHAPYVEFHTNTVYQAHGSSYRLFCNLFFGFLFLAFLAWGWFLNGRSFKGYGALLKDPGHRTSFIQKYGQGCVYINLGVYGLMMLAYLNAVTLLMDGAGFTGATTGVLLAAMSFAASGQHPRNVWPILAGFFSLWAGTQLVGHLLLGKAPSWTLATQGYINGAAFATGLCPFTGHYGKRAGLYAGILCAAMCTSTSVMHGGLVLYNGGLTAGITALILTPLLDHYYTAPLRK